MNFGKFDIVILVTMPVAVVAMSFTFPALGLTDAGTGQDDIPEFSMDSDRFDIAGDFPERPGTPQGGVISWDGEGDNTSANQNGDGIGEGSSGDGISIFTQPDYTFDPSGVEASLYSNADGQDIAEVSFESADVGSRETLEADGFVVEVTLTDYEIIGSFGGGADEDIAYSVDWEIVEEPGGDDQGFIERIPIVGSVVDAGSSLAGMVGWIGNVLYWGVTWMFEVALNMVGMLFDGISFAFDTVSWLTGTYNSVISSANSWAGVFVAIPGLLLFLELFKIVLVGLRLLPTT